MKLTPNLGPLSRVGYVLIGAGLMAAGWLGPLGGSRLGWVVAALGAISVVEGALGF